MKLSTTLATVSILAVSGWAAAPTSQPPAAMAAFFQGASCPTPAATVPKMTWKHGDAEYNDFKAAASATDPAQKAQLAAAFVQKYPDSDYKNEALQLEMGAQAQMPNTHAQAVQTAEDLLKSSGANAGELLSADVAISFLDPTVVQPSDPDLAAKMASLTQAAACGQQLLANATPAQQAQYGPILSEGQGFAQLNTKDYTGAIATLSKITQQNPKNALAYYWMGIAEVTQATPDYSTGIFDLAKAATLAPTTPQISSYLNTVYTSFHGSTDGLQDVMTTATNNATPPDGFKILSSQEVTYNAQMAEYNRQLEIQKNTLPPEGTFAGIEARLKKSDLAADEWKKVKGQGYELDGLVTDVTAKTVDIAVGETDTTKNAPADLHVLLAAPLTKRPQVGEHVTVDGVVSAYKPNPPDPNAQFVLTMSEGSIKGYSPTGK